MRNWGHTFIYDDATLRGALAGAGFHDVIAVTPGRLHAHPEQRRRAAVPSGSPASSLTRHDRSHISYPPDVAYTAAASKSAVTARTAHDRRSVVTGTPEVSGLLRN